ncbi:MAG: hypothetical protein KG003_00940, partial [Bacteroidetes bacterium]|nr:hypothetical protein [Bacteroidota bacterium]
MSSDDFSLGPFSRDEKNDSSRTWTKKLSKGNPGLDENDLDSSDSMVEELARLRKTVNRLEQKLFAEGKAIIEEEQKVAGIGNLGGKITANQNGTIRKTSFVLVCDGCGYPLQTLPAICPVDKRKVCIDCMVSIDQQDMCKGCLMRTRPLSKQSFKVLLLMSFRIDDRGIIRELTRMIRDDIQDSFGSLVESGYITRHGLSGFEITERGINIIVSYKNIYGKDEDVINLEKE